MLQPLCNIVSCLVRFVSLNFPHSPTVLVDNMSTRGPTEAVGAGRGLEGLPEVTEVRLVGLGLAGRRPLLLARTRDRELILYQAYEYHSPALAADQFCEAEALLLEEVEVFTSRNKPTLAQYNLN